MLTRKQDISSTTVTGLEDAAYVDKVGGMKNTAATGSAIDFTGETDRIYTKETADDQSVVSVVENGQPTFSISRDGLKDVVVWNPWDEKAKGMSDFGPADGWKQMVCVEAGSVTGWNKLEASDVWEGSQVIRADKS
jgi:glucose-6-phosphate 1-epimerase